MVAVPRERANARASAPWSKWAGTRETDFSVGVEEEVMLLDPSRGWSLSSAIDDVLAAWPESSRDHVSSETHTSAVELRTGVHATVGGAVAELAKLRAQLGRVLDSLGLAAGAAGTHPTAVWHEMQVSTRDRHRRVYDSMRALARREPTFALHVHVGLPSAEAGIVAFNRMRAHLPVLLALSANSPFWQGRDTGLASARTPLFQAFPRVGIPRVYGSYGEFVRAVDLLLDCGAFPDPTYLWWDVRLQPKLGTVELRIMDAQSTLGATAALLALSQSLVRLELVEGRADSALVHASEVLDENRFLAARDGADAQLVDPVRGRTVPVRDVAIALVSACAPHAGALGCTTQLELLGDLLDGPGPARQRDLAAHDGLEGVLADLATSFSEPLKRLEPNVAQPRLPPRQQVAAHRPQPPPAARPLVA